MNANDKRVDVFGFRKGKRPANVIWNFVFIGGGLGDYINWCAAIYYVAKELPYVQGRLIVKEPFYSVAKHLFANKFQGWRVIDGGRKDVKLEKNSYIYHPLVDKQLINATGAHLLDLGFMFYTGLNGAPKPEYNRLPKIDYNRAWRWPDLQDPITGRTKRYAVFTPGATTDARAMPAKHFNELVRYTIEKGLVPVFLGKKDFVPDKEAHPNYTARFDEGYDFTGGVDLRDQTSLLEAVQIMRHAKFVLGIDNGLLHFAGTTEVPIIFGHNITTVAHRRIRRERGITIDITLDEKDLPCIGCQSKMRFIPGHSFSKCAYTDYLCLDLLFAGGGEAWKKAINAIMEVTDEVAETSEKENGG